MKRIFLPIIIFLSCFVVQAQQSHFLYNTLNGDQDYHYTANSHIILSSGFQSEPNQGHEVILDIDNYGVFPPLSGITGGSPINNDHGVVGTLGGIVDVGLLGSAIYAIPIDLPQGLGGIKPQLSIFYNNQSHNGLLGWAWNLDGISAITRTGGTNYHDGYCSAVNYSQDRFCLDGQRLMKVSSDSYGGDGTTYRTEQDQLSKIVSYHESGVSGPSYFKVCTADGKILYYGNSSDSKALVNSQNYVNVWLLKKVEDHDGNYMEYHYFNASDTYRLSQITYSGNSHDNIAPTFSVEFQYDDRDDIEVSYIGNSLYRQDKILKGITIKNGNALMFSYQFKFKSTDPRNGYPYQLLSEIQLSAGNEHLNPTKIQWENNNYGIGSGADVKLNVTTNGSANAFVNAVKFSGDFNGDGYSDVIATRPNSQGKYTTAEVFINKGVDGNAIFQLITVLDLGSNISWIHVADFNGDGLDDILLSERIRNSFPNPDQISARIKMSHIGPAGTLTFNSYQTPTCDIPRNMIDAHLVGDFLGEGKCSVLIRAIGNDKLNCSKLLSYNATNDCFSQKTFPDNIPTNRLFAADYNGDGITEILYKSSNNATCIVRLTPSGNTYLYSTTYNGPPSNWNDCFPGDFNGDGLIDALFFNASNSNHWTIRLSNHLGMSETVFPLAENFPYSSPGNYLFSLDQPNHTSQYIKVGDFDGNGCSDLGLFKDNVFYVYYGPLRTSGDSAPFALSQRIGTQLFNLYDNMTMCLGNFLGQEGVAYLGSNTISHLPPLTKRHEVKKITDGFGRFTEFKYDYLMPKPNNPSANDFYRLNRSLPNPSPSIHYVAIPVRALQKVTKYNIKGKPVETKCSYEGGLLSTNGKGFLGFSKTRQEDYCNNQLRQKAIRQYGIESDDESGTFNMMPTSEYVYDGNNLMLAKSTYLNTLYTHLSNNRVFIPMSDVTKDEYDVDHSGNLIKREILETTVSTNCSENRKYNDILGITSQIKGISDRTDVLTASQCEYQQTTTTTYIPHNLAFWIINKPGTVTETMHRDGDYDDICHHKVFTYFNYDAHHIRTILDIPNDGSHPEDRLTTLTSFQYDLCGNVISKTISTPNDNLNPRSESFEYGLNYGKRLLTKHTDALNLATVYSYDPVYNHCTSSTDCNGLQTHHEQDPFGISCKTIHPDGTVSCKAIRWGSYYYYQWEKKTGQATKITCYDMSGDIIQNRSYDLDGELVLTDYNYDAFGRIISKTLPYRIGDSPQSIQYEYDSHNRAHRITHTDGNYETIQYNGNQRSTSFVDLNGTSLSESKTYNAVGLLIQSTDADGNTVIYDYYADGKPKWFQIDGYGETRIEMAYDGLGNRISLNDPNYGVTTCEYNAFNELTKSTSAKLDETHYFFDELGRITQRMEIDPNGNTTETTEWHYGQDKGQYGLLMQITSSNQTIDYEYDELNRLSRKTENKLGTNYQTRYTYDNASRMASIIHPSNFTAKYCYTSEGFLRSVMDAQSKDLWRVSEANASLQPTKCITGNGFVSYYDYDPYNNRLTSILTRQGNRIIQDYSYQYDNFSNMTYRDDLKHAHAEHFTYDNLSRLTSVTDNNGSSYFSYDALGRMTEKTGSNGAIFSNADYSGTRPHAIKAVQASPGTFPQERMDLTYTAFDKVSSISQGTDLVTFEYGYDHNRIQTTENVDGELRLKTYVDHCEFISQAGCSPIVRTLLSCPSGVFAVAETVNGTTSLHYVHKDHLGSWTTISDSDGNIEQDVQFDAWGNSKDADKLMFERGYTGHEHIRGMDIINMNGRLYDPVTSSMLSPDNNIQMPDFSQNLNRYAYCFNNPLSYTDPDGNTALKSALLFYLMYCTDYGYELQKYTSPIAFHLDFHLSSQQMGIGADCSIGVPKHFPAAARFHGGATYYWRYYDNSYNGTEFRDGMEWCFLGFIGISGTSFHQGDRKQTINAIILGTPEWSLTYENDYMFHLGDHLLMGYAADGGDRYRTAAARIRIGLFQVGVNLFTGDPGVDHKDRRTFYDPNTVSTYFDEEMGGRETYTIGANGENPNEFRAGVFYVGFGPFKVGANNEQIRNTFQNRFAHDFLCKGDSPYFQVLDRPRQSYFYFGSGTGNSLW